MRDYFLNSNIISLAQIAVDRYAIHTYIYKYAFKFAQCVLECFYCKHIFLRQGFYNKNFFFLRRKGKNYYDDNIHEIRI